MPVAMRNTLVSIVILIGQSLVPRGAIAQDDGDEADHQALRELKSVFEKAASENEDGEWKIVRSHSSLDPFGNPMVVAAVRRKLIQMGVGAGLGGLVLGSIVTWLVMRSRAGRIQVAG